MWLRMKYTPQTCCLQALSEKRQATFGWHKPAVFTAEYAATLAPPAVVASPTSRAAGRSVAAGGAQTTRRRVYAAICKAAKFGRTDEELQVELRLAGNSQRPARVWLMRDGLVWDSKRRRLTVSGRLATVWIAAEGCP